MRLEAKSFLLLIALLSLGFLSLFLKNQFGAHAVNPGITITNFSLNNTTVGATNVDYTIEFKLNQEFVGGTGASATFSLYRITKEGGDKSSNMSSATGVVASFQYQDPNDASIWNSISYDTNGFTAQINAGILTYYLPGITTNIPANTTVRLVVGGVTNPSKAGAYAFGADLTDQNNSNFSVDPYTDPDKIVRVDIGDYCFKAKVTAPDGTTAMPGLDIFVDSADHSFNSFLRTDYLGFVSFYSDGFVGLTNCPSGDSQKVYLFVNIPPGYSNPNHYLAPAATVLTLPGDRDTYVNTPVKLVQPTKTITGTISYSDGSGGVAGVAVNAFKKEGGTFVQTTTNGSGVYTLLVGGGEWEVMPQADSSSDWSYGAPPKRVVFQENNSAESKTVNFSVDKATATVTGRVLKPDGTPVSQTDGLGVGLFNMEGKGGGTQVGNNGIFQVNLPAGTYILEIWPPPNSSWGSPSLPPVTVKDGQTLDLGDITLVSKDATITGSVKVAGSNSGVAGVVVNAFRRKGGGFSTATTDANGNFSMSVVSGSWIVMPLLGPTDSYALTDPPQEVTVSSGKTASVSFSVKSATATIRGSVVDQSGNLLPVFGYAFAETSNGGMFGPGGLGGPIERGTFSFKVPAGTYTINVALAPGSNYSSGSGKTVTVSDGQTAKVSISLVANNATITGSFVDESGSPVSGVDLTVFAVAEKGGHRVFQEGVVNGSNYTIKVASGEWSLGYFVDPSSGYMSTPPDPSLRFSLSSGQTVTKNITLKKASNIISGKVTKPDGTAAVGVFVSADSREVGGLELFNGSPTDSSGNYTIHLADGTYKLRANVAPDSGYLSPAEQTVTLSGGENKTVNFVLRQSNASISGTVKLNGSGKPAFVYAWSDDGGFAQTIAGSDGSYTLAVSKGTVWHIGARYESGTTAYEATEKAVTMSGSSATADLTLAALDYSLPQPYSVTFDATSPKIITLTDGTEINIPANALATSGNVTLSINPKVSLPAKKGDRPVWYGYEFSATNSSGQAITQFNSSITVTFPYSDTQLAKLGVTADDLVPSYWDFTSGTWRKVDNVTVDTANKTVTIAISHFTDFALTANTGTTTAETSTSTSSSSSSSSSSGSESGGEEVSRPMASKGRGSIVEGYFNRVVLMIPADALSWDADFEIGKEERGFEKPKPPLWIVGGPYKIVMKSWWNGARFNQFRQPITLIIRYDPYVLGLIPESSLRLNYYDKKLKKWRPISSLLIKDRKEIAVVLDELAESNLYALVGGYGWQKTPVYVEKTITAEAESKEIGLTERILPKEKIEEKKRVSLEEKQPSSGPSAERKEVKKTGRTPWWKRVLKKILPFLF